MSTPVADLSEALARVQAALDDLARAIERDPTPAAAPPPSRQADAPAIGPPHPGGLRAIGPAQFPIARI